MRQLIHLLVVFMELPDIIQMEVLRKIKKLLTRK